MTYNMSSIHNKRKSNPVKFDLKIRIRNFGPISKGTLNLKPLTIFIGPNNSGKSYAAMLTHSILSSYGVISSMKYGLEKSDYHAICKSSDEKLQAIIKQNKGADSFSIPTSVTKKIYLDITKSHAKILESTINRNFGTNVSKLVRTNLKSAEITVYDSVMRDIVINKELNIFPNITGNSKYKIQLSNEVHDFVHEKMLDKNSSVITISKNTAKKFLKDDFTEWLLDSISKSIRLPNLPYNSYYFPATRSGILQGHQALSASIIQSLSSVGNDSSQIPKLTGIVADFMSDIILAPNRKGPFFDIARKLENELLHGHINMSVPAKGAFPEITYKSKNYEIPLHRASSTISEIAPLSLFLKYIIYPNSLIIIEEPESHLHLDNQMIFAKYIVKMIRAGLYVLVITHSVFLIEQIGKYILASTLKSDVRKKLLNIDQDDDYLLSEEVSTHVFTRKENDEHVFMSSKQRTR